jgi:SAM-dependent methyltransferase
MISARTIARALARRLLGVSAPPPAVPPDTQIAVPPPQTERPDIGLQDAMTGGLFNNDTGELYPGFAISSDDVVLDVGCGDGDKAHFCAMRGADIIYADVDPEQIAIAGRRLADSPARSLTPILSDSNPLPLADGVATRIIASEVIEHVDDAAQFLSELVRVGRSGALYLLTVPDPVVESLQTQLAPSVYFKKPYHVRIIGRDEFERMATDAGLVVEKRGAHGFYWALWWVFFWTSGVDLSAPSHPLLESWANTWAALLDTPDGRRVKQALDDFMPISQYLVARKP